MTVRLTWTLKVNDHNPSRRQQNENDISNDIFVNMTFSADEISFENGNNKKKRGRVARERKILPSQVVYLSNI